MKELFDAIRSGDLAAVESLLDERPELASAKNDSGLAVLTAAIYHRKPEIATLLEARGALFDLFAAAMAGREAELRQALAASPDSANSLSSDGWTPLHLAAFFGRRDCVEILLEAGAKVNERSANAMRNMPLHAAAAGRNVDVVRALLERGALVNAQQHGGWTALHAAAQSGDASMAQLLIAAGADLEARADNQQRAMDLALTNGHQQIVEMLERCGTAER